MLRVTWIVPPTHPGYGRPPADRWSGRWPSVAALLAAMSVFLFCTPFSP